MIANKKDSIKPDNLLLENSMSIFHLAMPLVSADRGANAGMDLREKLMQAFSSFEKLNNELQLDSSMISDVKYAIAAFVDEKVLGSLWPNKLAWMGKPLQLEYFGDNLAGEGFYTKLNKLRQGGERNIDALEVFYLCLQLGFEGMYRMRGLEQLKALQVDLRTQIADSRSRVPRTLSPHGGGAATFMEKVQRKVPYWVIAAVTFAVIFLTYIMFVTFLSFKADVARIALRDDAQRITANLEKEASQKKQSEYIPPEPVAPPKVAPPLPPVKVVVRKPKKVIQEAPVAPVVAPVVVPAPEAPPPKAEPKKKVVTPIMGF